MERNKSLTFSSYDFLIIFMILPFFITDGIMVLFDLDQTIIYLCKIFVFFFIVFLYVVYRRMPSKMMIILLIIYGTIFMSAYQHASLELTLFNFSDSFIICLLFDFWLYKKPFDFLNCLRILLFLLIIANLISVILYPDGIYEGTIYTANWILGYKNSHGNYIYIYCLLEVICSYHKKNKLSLFSYLSFILCCLGLILCDSVTYYVLLILFVIILFLFIEHSDKKFIKKIMKIISFKMMIIVTLLFTVIIVILQNLSWLQKNFGSVLLLLNRDSSFTGRLSVWSTAIRLFLSSPILGRGMVNPSTFVNLSGIIGGTHAHNYILNILVIGGIVSLIEHMYLYIYTIKKLDRVENIYSYAIGIMLGLYFVVGLTAINFSMSFFNCIFILAYYLSEGNKKDN